MDLSIFLSLFEDGLVNGAVFALLAVALVLVFVVTRVILLAQGAYVAFAALTLDLLEKGTVPGTTSLLVAMGGLAFVVDLARDRSRFNRGWLTTHLVGDLAFPVAVYALVWFVAPLQPPLAVSILLTLLLIAPIGPYLYRLAFQPLEQAPVLVLLIASVGAYLALTIFGLVWFGPEGMEGDALLDASFDIADVTVSGQSAIMFAASLVLMAGLWLFFGRSLYGKAMRAVAVNRVGARLVGIPISQTGQVAFLLASLIGAISGVLVSSVTMVYFDSGFFYGLLGFVAAIVGGMGSYPLSVLGALFVGELQSFSGFWNSAYSNVIVFTALIPVLMLRSLRAPPVEDEE